MSDSTQTAAICPLCAGSNKCAIAAGQPAESCWCQTATISAEARAKAADSAGEQCICRACGKPTGELNNAG